MRCLIQRVANAHVSVDGVVVGQVAAGMCLLVGINHDDDAATVAKCADKVVGLRIFEDDDGRMNRSILEAFDRPEVLVVSQFTLYAKTDRGRRPSFVDAAPGPVAEPLIERFCALLADRGVAVSTGVFGADMLVSLTNDGPVTIMVEL